MRSLVLMFVLVVITPLILSGQSGDLDSLISRLRNHSLEDTVRVDLLNEVAFGYAHSNPKLLRNYANESLTLANSLNYSRGTARALNVIASSFWVQGEYNLGLDYYTRSLRIYEEIDDKRGIFVCYNNMGEIYKKLKNFDAALAYHEQALSMKMRYLPGVTPLMSYVNIAEVHLGLKSLESAKEYFDRALSLAVEQENSRTEAYALSGLGEILVAYKQYDLAISNYNKALKLRVEMSDLRGAATSSLLLGQAYTGKGEYNHAELNFKSALRYSEIIGARDLETQITKSMYMLDSSRGDYLDALAHNTRYNVLRDSLFTLEKEKQLARIQTIYDVEKKEKANALLLKDKKSNEELIRYQAVINIGVALGLILFGVMSFVLYQQREQKIDTNYLLSIRNEEVSKQKEALLVQAQALQHLNQTLEDKVAERTCIINEKNAKLREYAFMNAHNVRGPLTNILSLTDLLNTLGIEGEERELIKHLQASAEKLDKVIHDIKMNLEKEEFNA